MINASEIASRVLGLIAQMHGARQPRVLPTELGLARVIEDLFWLSLDRYEGIPLVVRVYFPPRPALTGSHGIMRLTAKACSRELLRKLGHSHPQHGGLLVLEAEDGTLTIEGMLANPSVFGGVPGWVCVESRGPGTVRISSGFNKLFETSRGKARQLGGMPFDRHAAEVMLMGAGLFPSAPEGLAWHVAAALVDIGLAIEERGHGGAIWILPPNRTLDDSKLDTGFGLSCRPDIWEPYREMWERRTSCIRLLNPNCDGRHNFLQSAAHEWDTSRQRALTTSIASLAKIDGAILVTGTPDILAFGVICNHFETKAVDVLRVSDGTQTTVGTSVCASTFGGSRHQSAINFCSSFAPAGAIVASHDGGLSAFASVRSQEVFGSQISLFGSSVEVNSD